MAIKNRRKSSDNSFFFKDERFKFLVGVFTFFLSVFLILSFISYLFTWKIDQSFQWSKVFSGIDVQVDNWSGKSGAYLSNILINNLFGVTSFLIPFFLIVYSLKFFHIRLISLKKTFKYTVIGLIIGSIWLGYIFGDMNGYLGSGLGGLHGFFMATWLNSFLGKAGTAFLLILITLGVLFYLHPGIFKSLKNIKGWIISEPEEKTDIHGNYSIEDDDDDDYDDDQKKQEIEFSSRSNKNINEEKQPDTDKAENGKEESEEDDVELTIEEINQEQESDQKYEKPTSYDPTLDLSSYNFPTFELLEDHSSNKQTQINKEELIENKNRIVETLANYKIQIDKIKATVGPTVTLYEIIPAPGVRISKIKNLEDDIALSLAALGIRIIAPIPGRGTIGIEVPNQNPEIVSLLSVFKSKAFQESDYALPIALGKTISNETYVVDLAKMPHLLIAGATGQGKSVGLNAIIASFLYKKHPAELKFIMIDPKKVELTLFSKIEKHFLAKLPDTEEPIITDTQKVINTLNSLTIEMDNRYNLLKAAHVRNIKEYNAKFKSRKLNPEKGHKFLPYIVVIVDEFADLIMTAGKEIEGPLARLAQLARAIGIHLIIATQRPSANIITGVIKANFPARIAFKVTSMIDSRTILDSPGANQLIGRGDMLISHGSELTRLQCAFIDTPELDSITDFISSQQSYPSAFILPEYVGESTEEPGEVNFSKKDELFEEAAKLVVRHQQGSTSLIQRKFSIGYNRAGRIIDQLEAANIVGPFEGSKARQVLFADEYSLEQYLKEFLEKNQS